MNRERNMPDAIRPLEHEQDQLVQRADEAIAESARLVDALRKLMTRAQQLNKQLDHLHWLRTKEHG
jgi:glucose-6-phosphate dehydrogenase assembly protein OpcA